MRERQITSTIKKILVGMLMPAFLLSPFAAVGSDLQLAPGLDPVKVIFAITDETVLSEYEYIDLKRLFGGGDLPETYTATVNPSDYASMQSDPGIEYVEFDGVVSSSQLLVSNVVTTNDPYFTLDDKNDSKQWYLEKIKLPEAWKHGTGSAEVKVAIIDTGIHAAHLELNDGRVIAGFDLTTDLPIPADSNSDDNGHGTAVAGIIGGIPNNQAGIAGMNWEISMMPVKALAANGSGDISDVAAAIVWAADNDADIINLSLGGPGYGNDQTLNNAIIHAYNKGALIIAAAGNDLAEHGNNLDVNPVYPICADGGQNMVIGVAASDVNDKKASFSNYSINCVDIIAPGKKILTTAYLPAEPSNNILIYGSGTSLAAPLVSGVAALLKANRPNLSNAQIKNIILGTTDDIDSLNQNTCLGASCNGYLGRGRLNAEFALNPSPLLDGTLVRELGTGVIYQIDGGKKYLVTEFVFKHKKYSLDQVVDEMNNQLADYPTGTAISPGDGLLLKGQTDPTVYYIHQGVRRPLTYLVFQSRNFSFANVQTVSEAELAAIPIGEWYWPPDGTMVLIKGDPTVYVMENSVKRPVTYFVFIQRKLSFARVVTVTQDEFGHIPQAPDSFWLPPLEGTLVKSSTNNTVYLILEGSKRPLTFQAFQNRKLSFGNVRTLPQAEMDVIQTGSPLIN